MASSDDGPSFVERYAVIHGPLVVSICIFGITTNIVNIIVLTRRQMIGPTNILLTGLSSAQLVLLCNYLVYTIYVIMDDECNRSTKTYAWLSYLLLNVNLNLVFHTIALVHTTSLAVFRYVAIAFPVKWKKLVSVQAARRIVLAAFVSVPIVCTTFYPNSVVVAKNVTFYECPQWTEDSDLYELRYHAGRRALRDYNFWFFGTVCKLLPCSLLVILSFLLIQEMRRVRQRRKRRFATTRSPRTSNSSFSHNEWHRRQVTIMLVAIVLLFVIVELPQGIMNMLSAILKDAFIDTYTSLGDFFEMLTVLYSSVNFILYCTMSSQFRATFKVLFVGPCSGYQTPDGKWTRLSAGPKDLRLRRTSTGPRTSQYTRTV